MQPENGRFFFEDDSLCKVCVFDINMWLQYVQLTTLTEKVHTTGLAEVRKYRLSSDCRDLPCQTFCSHWV